MLGILALKQDKPVFIFQYMPCLATDVRDKLISDPWFVWISNHCSKMPQVIFTMQKNKENYWDATVYELPNFFGKDGVMNHNSKLQSVNCHIHQQVIFFSYLLYPLQCWNKNVSRNTSCEHVRASLMAFFLLKEVFWKLF